MRQSELPPCVTKAVPVTILGDRMRLGVLLRAGEVEDMHAQKDGEADEEEEGEEDEDEEGDEEDV